MDHDNRQPPAESTGAPPAPGPESVSTAVADHANAEGPASFSAHLGSLRGAVGEVLHAKADLYRAKARNAVILVILACFALVAVLTLIVTTTVLLLKGLAGGLAQLLGNRIWLGELVLAVLLISATYVTIRVQWSRSDRRRAAEQAQRNDRLDAQRTIPVRDGTNSDAVQRNQIS